MLDEIRQYTIFGMAIFDWVLTLIGSYILIWFLYPYFMNRFAYINFFIVVTISVIILGIIIHKILGIDTMLGYYLGLNMKPKRIKIL